MSLPMIRRPNGMIYRPHKLSAHTVADADEIICGVVVFGTHDPATAQPLAERHIAWQMDDGYVPVSPSAVWWRDGFENGRRCWVADEVHGRAGVWFADITERPREDVTP